MGVAAVEEAEVAGLEIPPPEGFETLIPPLLGLVVADVEEAAVAVPGRLLVDAALTIGFEAPEAEAEAEAGGFEIEIGMLYLMLSRWK